MAKLGWNSSRYKESTVLLNLPSVVTDSRLSSFPAYIGSRQTISKSECRRNAGNSLLEIFVQRDKTTGEVALTTLAIEAHPNQVSQEAQETVSDSQEIGSVNLTGMQEHPHILYRYQSRPLYDILYHRPRLRRRRLSFLNYKF